MPCEPRSREVRRRATPSRSSSIAGLPDAVERVAIDVDGAVTEQVAEALLQRRVLGELVVGDAGHLGDDDRSGRQLGIRPGDQEQALVPPGFGAARVAEAVEIAALRNEVELDPGALQFGEHHVRMVIGEERTRQIDLDVVVDDAGIDGVGELGPQRATDTLRLDLVVGDRCHGIARPHS